MKRFLGFCVLSASVSCSATDDDGGDASGGACGIPVSAEDDAGPAPLVTCRVTLSGDATTGFATPVSFDVSNVAGGGAHPGVPGEAFVTSYGSVTLALSYNGYWASPQTALNFAWTWTGGGPLCIGALDPAKANIQLLADNDKRAWICATSLPGDAPWVSSPFSFQISSGEGRGKSYVRYSFHGSGKAQCSPWGYYDTAVGPLTVEIVC